MDGPYVQCESHVVYFEGVEGVEGVEIHVLRLYDTNLVWWFFGFMGAPLNFSYKQ